MSQPSELISLIPSTSPSSYWADRLFIPDAIQKEVEPFLLPYDHPARKRLDEIYSNSDFELQEKGAGSEVTVKSDKMLEEMGVVIKEPRNVSDDYKKLLRRVRGHRAGTDLIENRSYTHVKVTRNWLYPRPGDGDVSTWSIHYLTKPVRLALKTLGLKSPLWLKYPDKIFLERFIVVEESIEIKPFLRWEMFQDKNLIDECIPVILATGFRDVNFSNYCADESGRLVLFDVANEYSKKIEKRIALGQHGIKRLFPGSTYAQQKLQEIIGILHENL